jgi:hypothetical protein
MRYFKAAYYRDRSGSEPVREFLVGLGRDARAALVRQIERFNMLSESMPHLPFPHSSQVAG